MWTFNVCYLTAILIEMQTVFLDLNHVKITSKKYYESNRENSHRHYFSSF